MVTLKGNNALDYSAKAKKGNLNDFRDWLETSQGGAIFCYAIHKNLGDKDVSPDTLQMAELAKQEYAKVTVELAQQRQEPKGPFLYLAVKKCKQRIPRCCGENWRVRHYTLGMVRSNGRARSIVQAES